MTDPGFTVYIVETRTGNIVLNDLPYLDTPRFSRQLNDDSNITVVVPVGDRGAPSASRLMQLISPWRFSLAVAIGNTILSYGPIITWQFDHANMNLTIGAGSIWALLARRLLINPGQPITSPLSMDPVMDMNYGTVDLSTIAKLLVSDSNGRGVAFNLPMDFPANVAGSASRNYPIYDLATVGQRLKDITQVENGPDIDWDPYFVSSSQIRITMRIGTPRLTQFGPSLLWDDGSGLTYVDVDMNGSTMTSLAYTRGNATERATEVAFQQDGELLTYGWPALESVDTSHQSVTDFATLQSYANEWVRFYKFPVQLQSCDVVTDVTPVVGTYKPGDIATFNLQNHPLLPPGTYNQRITGWESAGENRLRLILEPTVGMA